MKDYIKNLRNKKGFTLIELLAVIVILALLVLIATPIVQRVIQNSQKNSFKNEITALSGYLDNAYSDYLMMNKLKNGQYPENSVSNVDFCIKVETSKVTVCGTMAGLKEEGFVKKGDTNNWTGYVKTIMNNGSKSNIIYNISDGSYSAKTAATGDTIADSDIKSTAEQAIAATEKCSC